MCNESLLQQQKSACTEQVQMQSILIKNRSSWLVNEEAIRFFIVWGEKKKKEKKGVMFSGNRVMKACLLVPGQSLDAVITLT